MGILRIPILVLLSLVLSACIKPHQIDIQQGNLITEKEVSQLELGMSKREVRYILGTPLIVDPFHQNRWDYFYSFDRRGEDKVRRAVTIIFEDDKLTTIEGDITINTENTVAQESSVITESPEDDKGFFERTWDKIWPGGE